MYELALIANTRDGINSNIKRRSFFITSPILIYEKSERLSPLLKKYYNFFIKNNKKIKIIIINYENISS